MNFSWFGADTPDVYTGPPVRVPHPLKTYWGPGWNPGNVAGTVTIGGSGTTVSFSGDEQLVLNCVPAPEETFDPLEFTIRFPALSHRARIDNGTPTTTYEAAMAPTRTLAAVGTDREGNPFSFTVDTSVLTETYIVDLVRSSLENGSSLDPLADAIEELLEAGAPDLFERPSVLWHDDGDETGLLHVSLSFASGDGDVQPTLTTCDLSDLLNQVGGTSLPAQFTLDASDPLSSGSLTSYLIRNVIDAHVGHSQFGPRLADSYFDLDEDWRPWARIDEGGALETRISLSTKHGREPAIIELVSQIGLTQLGFDNPVESVGTDTSFSGSGNPKFDNGARFEDRNFMHDVYTAMIDATVDQWGDEATAVTAFNRRLNCEGMTPIECYIENFQTIVVTPVFPGAPGAGTSTEPDLVKGERGASTGFTMKDNKAVVRGTTVQPISSARRKIVMKIAPASIESPNRASESAGTLAHELGHALLGLPDLYGGGKYRDAVTYMGSHCLMGNSGSFSHFCAYNKRIKGWLDDQAVLLLDRPPEDDPIDQEIVLIQLEYWNPTLSEAEWLTIAQSALSGVSDTTPVVAAAFLRLGGDGQIFDIVELRGPTLSYSTSLSPPRVVVSNAIDPLNDTRYSETELEDAGTTAGVLERYRRKVHLLSSNLRQDVIGTDEATYDFASDPEFPEVGLTTELLEWGTASGPLGNFNLARVRVVWERGAAINLGFKDSTPDWQSRDIAIIRPEGIDDEGEFTFPEDQDDAERFRVPPDGADPLPHKVAVRLWNFGDAAAENVVLGLLRRVPKGGGGGDWETDAEFEELLPEPVVPSSDADPPIVAFDWDVPHDTPSHLCFRAQVGDRDVPRDDNGLALASDDTDVTNDWAQQNVFEFEAPADSPPDPVEFTFEVNNAGSYVETVTVAPVGLDDGAELTISPPIMTISPRSRGFFRVRAVLDERLLDATCGKDIDFLLQVYRPEDHAEERWGASRIVIKPRRRTETTLSLTIMPERLRLFGQVTPDVGAQEVLLQIQRPGLQTTWTRVPLGPNSTYDFEVLDDFPNNIEVQAVAFYDGSFEHARSASEPQTVSWFTPG